MTLIHNYFCFFLLFFCFSQVYCDKNILVLVDNLVVRETHSQFFQSLQDRGYKLTIKTADDPQLQLVKYGKHLFEHLILFSPTVDEFGGQLSSSSIAEYIDNGGNVLIAANSDVGAAIRELSAECGIEFDKEKNEVIDHFNFDSHDEGNHNLIVSTAENLIDAEKLVGIKNSLSKFVFRGISLIPNKKTSLIFNVLTGSPTSFSYNSSKIIIDNPTATGKNVVLISAFQARNNARVLVSGSLEFFSNKFFDLNQKSYDNQKLVDSLSKWVFKEEGVLRVKSVEHYKEGEKEKPQFYTITDNVLYKIQIEEFVGQKWIPFKGNDVQLEFVRIDPFVRTKLVNENDKHVAKFKLPDVYGVFKFLVNYNRIGYTYLYSSTQVSVRPLEHTQYERFIKSAYPYYASAFSMMLGVFIFSFAFLYHKDKPLNIKKN